MGISVLKRNVRLLAQAVVVWVIAFIIVGLTYPAHAADTAGIDDETVITVEQAGSIAKSVGDYGWDSRGAVIDYCSIRGDISGSLGTILFTDESGVRRPFLWDDWGGAFPDRWGRMLAEKLRASTPENEIPAIRAALSDSMVFNCTWMIAIGTKSQRAGGRLYKTLRTDNTLRVAYGKNLDREAVAERLFTGDEMQRSLQYILPREKWGSSSLTTFAERNPYSYLVQINSYDIDVHATNCIECARKGLSGGSTSCTHVKAGTYFNERLPIEYDGKEYFGDRSFAWEGQTVRIKEPVYPGHVRNTSLDDRSDLVGVMNGDMLTPSGDSTVFLYYEPNMSTDSGQTEQAGEISIPDEPVVTDSEHGQLISVNDPLAYAAIRSDVFDVTEAVPSTEPVYIYATARDYLYSLDASVISGTWGMNVTVTLPYELTWKEKKKTKRESGYITHTVTVSRPYSYVHLNAFAYYTLESITIGNRAMSPSRTVLTPAVLGISMPSCTQPVSYGNRTPSMGANVMLPNGFSSNITMQTMTVSSDGKKPEIPDFSYEDAKAAAEAAVGSMQCRNDEIVFSGMNILGTTGWHSYSGTESLSTGSLKPARLTFDTRKLYGENYMTVPAGMRNSTYVSDARVIKYSPVVRYGGATINYTPLLSVNNLCVHTPVVCEITMEESFSGGSYISNTMYNQETVGPEPGIMQLVIGETSSYGIEGHENDSCDFILGISNSGKHGVYSSRLGESYNYYYNVAGTGGAKYVMTNEVRFPFDVYQDLEGDRRTSGDRLIQAGQWLDIGTGKYRFYLPDYITEGDYVIEARSRAVNSYSRDDAVSSEYKNGRLFLHDNSSCYDYIAADSVKVHVSGKMSGLRLCGISSEQEWGNVELSDRQTVLLSNDAGVKKLIDGTLKTSLAEGRARPNELADYFFYYTCGVNNELGLPSGRHERFILPLLAGSHPDTTRQNIGILRAGYDWKFEVDTTGTVMSEKEAFLRIKPVFSWISPDMKTREPAEIFYRSGFMDRGREAFKVDSSHRHFAGLSGSRYRQTWEFTYSLPCEPVVKTGDTVRKNGYLAVGFEITANRQNGKEYLVYSGTCNMWATEGQKTGRTDYYGHEFVLNYGDVIVLDIEKTKADDYLTDHRY